LGGFGGGWWVGGFGVGGGVWLGFLLEPRRRACNRCWKARCGSVPVVLARPRAPKDRPFDFFPFAIWRSTPPSPCWDNGRAHEYLDFFCFFPSPVIPPSIPASGTATPAVGGGFREAGPRLTHDKHSQTSSYYQYQTSKTSRPMPPAPKRPVRALFSGARPFFANSGTEAIEGLAISGGWRRKAAGRVPANIVVVRPLGGPPSPDSTYCVPWSPSPLQNPQESKQARRFAPASCLAFSGRGGPRKVEARSRPPLPDRTAAPCWPEAQPGETGRLARFPDELLSPVPARPCDQLSRGADLRRYPVPGWGAPGTRWLRSRTPGPCRMRAGRTSQALGGAFPIAASSVTASVCHRRVRGPA